MICAHTCVFMSDFAIQQNMHYVAHGVGLERWDGPTKALIELLSVKEQTLSALCHHLVNR